MKKNAKLAALAILVLAAVAALSVGITLAVVNARMPAACTCSGQCRSTAVETAAETAAAGDASSTQQTEPPDPDSISIPGFDFLSLQAGAQEQSMPLYNPENNACYFRISLLLDGQVKWADVAQTIGGIKNPLLHGAAFVDEYRGKQVPEGKKSLTARLTIGSAEKTLTSAEIEEVANSVLKKLAKRFGAELRSR